MFVFIVTFFIVSLLVAFVIIGTKLFYPYHIRIGMLIPILTLLVLSVFSSLSNFPQKNLDWVETISPYALPFFVLFSVVFIGMLLFDFLSPLKKNIFKNMSESEIANKIQNDLNLSVIVLDHLTILYEEFLHILKKMALVDRLIWLRIRVFGNHLLGFVIHHL